MGHEEAPEAPEDGGLEVVVGASPAGPNLFPEIRLIKPALLYADRVRVFSPMASMLSGLALAAEAEGVDRARVMIALAEAAGTPLDVQTMKIAETLIGFDSLPRAERRRILGGKGSKDVRRLVDQLNAAWEELRRKVSEQMEQAGAGELATAVESGFVEIEPLLDEDRGELEDLFEEFVLKLASVLAEGRAFPLFDDRTGSLVAAGVAEGLFAPSAESLRRGKEMGAAAQFMSHLPAFPPATIGEVLDIRDDLREPLIRFRSAMVKIARLLDSAPYEEDFTLQVESIRREEVVPAVQEIQERVRDNAFLRQLLGEAAKDIPKWLGRGFVALAVTPWSDVPALVVAGATALEPTATAAWKKYQEGKQIRKAQYYFLYETDRLLS
jgi:hypothetical protein